MTSAATSGFEIRNWRPHQKESLRAFSVILPSGLVVHDCRLHEKGNRRWVGLPTKTFEAQGGTKFTPVVDFIDRDSEDRFRTRTLDAIDKHLSEAKT